MVTTPTTLAETKPAYLSKTNITAVLLVIFGGLTAFGRLPAEVATPGVVGSIVAAGGVLVAFFRTTAKALIK